MARKNMDRQEEAYLPTMEPVINKRVHAAAKRYAKLRDARMAANQEEKDAHVSLLAIMKEEGLTSYTYQDVEIHIDATEKAKVKINGQDKGGEE